MAEEMEIIEGEELTEEEKATGVVEISADALQSAEPNELSEEELEEIAGGANQIQVYSKPKKYCPWCNMHHTVLYCGQASGTFGNMKLTNMSLNYCKRTTPNRYFLGPSKRGLFYDWNGIIIGK